MSLKCELTGKTVGSGNNVSHSERKTRRKFKPNLQYKRFFSRTQGVYIRLRVSTKAIKSVDKYDGIDNFVLRCDSEVISNCVLKFKKALLKSKSIACS